jgi:rhamnulokinase
MKVIVTAPEIMSAKYYLAVDLGAESGRVMLGTLREGNLSLEEIHRFQNRAVTMQGHLHWDLPRLEAEIFVGLKKAGERDLPISGVSADSWGLDYIWLSATDEVLAPPFCYRDTRTNGMPERLFKKIPFAGIYELTGIQFMAINTLYHLEAEQGEPPAGADHFLTIADYFNARFSGVHAVEESLASTTQLYNPRSRAWAPELISKLDLSPALFPKIVPSGTVLGPVAGILRDQSSLASAQVIATCSHDTGAAVAAVPAGDAGNWAYLSSGTWSLLGAELPGPVITDAAREAGFTNEVGLGGTIRFLKNIAGLWILQECRRAWEAAGQTFTYEELTQLARDAGPAKTHLALSDPRFVSSGEMPEKIAAFCRETAQPVPATTGDYVRTILESLALTYDQVLGQLEMLIGRKIQTLHIVGGGTHNQLLNQLTADATERTVMTGPVEATAIGNVLIQALALGHIESAAQIRRIVGTSFPTRTFLPGSMFSEETRLRFQKLQGKP